MVQKLTSVLLGVFIIVLTSGNALGQGWEQLLSKLYQAAKHEGEVVVNSGSGDLGVGGTEGIAEFAKRFPGIKISVTNISSTQLYPRIVAEARAGKITIDLDMDDPPAIKAMVDKGLIATLNPTELTDKPNDFSYFYGNKLPVANHTVTHLIYNTKLVSKSDLPSRYEDLLDPKWKGRLALESRGPFDFAYLRLLWNEQRFWQFIKGIAAQNPIWDTRCVSSADRVVSGEAYIGCGSFARLMAHKAKGAPVDSTPISPIFVRAEVFVPFKGSLHPNATKLLIGWLLSPEGTEAVDKVGTGPARVGTRYYGALKAIGAELYFSDRLTLDQLQLAQQTREEIAKTWGVVK